MSTIIKNKKTIIFLLFLFVNLLTAGNYHNYYFYKPNVKIGSESFFNPFTVYINCGFDYLRNGRIKGNPFKSKAFHLLNDNLIHFPSVISNFNKKETDSFWERQIYPGVWEKKYASWIPNYKSHLIGEGMLCRKMAEWYDYRGASYPYFWGVVSTFAFQYTNEWIEYGSNTNVKKNTDPVADIIFMNPVGWLLFYFDPIAKFFSETIGMNSWQMMPAINPLTGRLANLGESYYLKTKIPYIDNYRFFYRWGIDGLAGLSYKYDKSYSISAGVGLRLSRVWTENGSDYESVLDPAVGIYWDYEESLLFSIYSYSVKNFNLKLNLYPGVLKFNNLADKFGCFVSLDNNTFQAGITCNLSPLGLWSGTYQYLTDN